MKKIISAAVAASIAVTAMSFGMTASAANDPEDYTKDSLVIGSLDTYVGNGWCQNGQWGYLTAQQTGSWTVDGKQVNKFTEGEASSGISGAFTNQLTFFHNFVWDEDGAFIKQDSDNLDNVGKYGVKITENGYNFVEFDMASEYDMDIDNFSICMCGDVKAWHGYNADRKKLSLKGQTWYHVVVPITEFEYGPDGGINPDGFDTSANAKYALSCAQRIRFEMIGLHDPDNDGGQPEDVSIYFDGIRITKGSTPYQAETLTWTPARDFSYDPTDSHTLTKYNGSSEDVVIPSQVTKIAEGVFAGKNVKTVTIGEQVTEIGANNFEDIDGIVIIGIEGSYAQTYAEDNGLEFQAASPIVYGDVNGDGNVTVNDALLALQAAVGKITFTEDRVRAGDVDGSGSIAVSDALLILQRAVDKIPNFPVEKA